MLFEDSVISAMRNPCDARLLTQTPAENTPLFYEGFSRGRSGNAEPTPFPPKKLD